MNRPRWINWAIAALIRAMLPMAASLLLGGTQARCVGVNDTGTIVKAMGTKCSELDQVVIIELGEDGQIQYSGAETVEFGP